MRSTLALTCRDEGYISSVSNMRKDSGMIGGRRELHVSSRRKLELFKSRGRSSVIKLILSAVIPLVRILQGRRILLHLGMIRPCPKPCRRHVHTPVVAVM